MDATPSPQSVGREFVRQYYTLLNKAPHHLHRFYNHQSSFVHGGLEPANSTRDCLVIGQKQIHNKIQQLNFRDCHAKISQVDAQATLGNGVVVQVTGELSNDGQPMRRFTQTFVLAAQAPKKYYVHNDIFRYQDVVWDEDQQQQPDSGEQDSDARSEEVNDADPAVGGGAGDVVVQAAAVELQQQHVGVVNMQQQQQPNQVEAVQQQQQFYNHTAAVKPAPGIFPSSAPSSTLPVVNGTAATTQASVAAPAVDNEQVHRVPVQQQQPAVVSQAIQSETTAENSKPVVVDEVVKVPAAAAEKKEQRIAAEVPFKPPQPETFASLVKSGGGPGGRVISSTRGPAAPVAIQSVSVVSSGGGGAGGRGERDQPREQQSNQNSSNSNSSNQNLGGGGGGPRERRSSTNNNGGPREQYGDSQQLFVGNIPHHATEDELKAMFGKYGVVIDLRIFTKQSQALPSGGKGSTGRVPQNYGFVTFRESESAQAVLANPVSGQDDLEELRD